MALVLTLMPAGPVQLDVADGSKSILFIRNKKNVSRLTIKTTAAIRYYREGQLVHDGKEHDRQTAWSTTVRPGDQVQLERDEVLTVIDLDRVGTKRATLRIDAPDCVDIFRPLKHGGSDVSTELLEA